MIFFIELPFSLFIYCKKLTTLVQTQTSPEYCQHQGHTIHLQRQGTLLQKACKKNLKAPFYTSSHGSELKKHFSFKINFYGYIF